MRHINPNYPYLELKDYGPQPFVINIDEATKQNDNYRTALWTGEHLQLTLMSIPVGGDIGLEMHPDVDQFIRIEEGQGLVQMGKKEDALDFQENVYDNYAFFIPVGTWHNLINTGREPIKLYSIYAPPQHPFGTVHVTKEDAQLQEHGPVNQAQEMPATTNEMILGAKAAKEDKKLTLENMLTYAIQDEYLARTRYRIAMERFGRQDPFANLIRAEEKHINYLKSLLNQYGVEIPADNTNDYVKVPETLKESYEQGMQGEKENIEMYNNFLMYNIPSDIRAVFTFFRNASQNHLRAFQRALMNC